MGHALQQTSGVGYMILYENTIDNFSAAMKNRKLISFIEDEYYTRTSRKVSPLVKGIWKYTLEVLKQLIESSEINPECGIRIDYVVLDTNNRFEVIIAGKNNTESVIHIIEMLSWENVRDTEVLDLVSYDSSDSTNKKCVHPSFQSVSYKKYFSKSLSGPDIFSCVYLFECSRNADSVRIIDNYKSLTQEAPIYFAEDSDLLSNKLSVFKTCTGGKEVLNEFHNRDQLSSNGIDAFLTRFISNKELTALSEEQRLIIASVIKKSDERSDSLFVVDGAPGTGKTMLAVSCMAELVNRNKKVIYLTSTMVQCELLQQELKKKTSYNYDIKVVPRFLREQRQLFQEYDVIILDEAQRITSVTNHNPGSSRALKTIMGSGVVIVFIQNNLQIIDGQIISEEDLSFLCSIYNKTLYQFNLNRNMRYAGRGSGIHWLSHQFQIADTGNYDDWDADSFEICIADTPQELVQNINTKKENGKTGRILVRYRMLSELDCDKNSGQLFYSIPEYDFRIPVYTASSRGWTIDYQRMNYAMGPVLAQGLEYDYVGVIIGNELGYDREAEKVIINSSDLSDNSEAIRLIKTAYYVLLSRGKNGVYLFIQDPLLKEVITERLEYASRRFSWIKELAGKYQSGYERNLIDKQKQWSSYSYAISAYEAVNEFMANLKKFSKEQLDGDQYKAVFDQCSELLLKLQSDPMNQTEIREKYQRIIIRNIGESAWDKLSDIGKKCLISAELTYHDMKDYNQLYDFSSVCVQVSKAVEFELTKRFYSLYVAYLEAIHERTTHPDAFYDRVPNVIKKRERGRVRLLKEQEVTLGTIPFIVGLNMEGRVTDPDAYTSFERYALTYLLQSGLDIKGTLSKHVRYIVRIKNDYRNKAAHKNPMDVVTAKACLNYVIEVEKALGHMLDDYIR